jgi:hypothetical protein
MRNNAIDPVSAKLPQQASRKKKARLIGGPNAREMQPFMPNRDGRHNIGFEKT